LVKKILKEQNKHMENNKQNSVSFKSDNSRFLQNLKDVLNVNQYNKILQSNVIKYITKDGRETVMIYSLFNNEWYITNYELIYTTFSKKTPINEKIQPFELFKNSENFEEFKTLCLKILKDNYSSFIEKPVKNFNIMNILN
jgi:hypothetical protein